MQYDLVHIAAGDLLRAEVAAGSENGRRARKYMEKGQLVPDEIVVMVTITYSFDNNHAIGDLFIYFSIL